MQDDRGDIENLMARYCELFDSGDLDGDAALFADKFKKVLGNWRFAERECEPYLAGDLSRHAREHPEPGPVLG